MCDACWQGVVPITPPLCERCGAALPSWRVVSLDRAQCPACRRMDVPIERARSIGAYDGALRAILHAFKYGRRESLSVALGARLRVVGSDVLQGADAVVPVPLHPRRRRERGFNQSELLARQLGMPVVPALTRTRETASQTSLPEAQRHRNVRGAFSASGSPVAGRCLVLVDDVTTTGATLQACARALKAAGAREVRALTVARAERRRR